MIEKIILAMLISVGFAFLSNDIPSPYGVILSIISIALAITCFIISLAILAWIAIDVCVEKFIPKEIECPK
jgi:hypothetical protein